MNNIKRFIEKVNAMNINSRRDLIMPITEAYALKDEIVNLLIDKIETRSVEKNVESKEIRLSGGRW